MSIIRWNRRLNPWLGLHDLGNEIDRFFGENRNGFIQNRGTPPSVNVYEKSDQWVLTFEVPGVAPENLELNVKERILTLRGRKKSEPSDEEGKVHCHEYCVGEFSRSLTLPEDVDTESVEADIENGILTVVLKKAEKALERKIEIRRLLQNSKK